MLKRLMDFINFMFLALHWQNDPLENPLKDPLRDPLKDPLKSLGLGFRKARLGTDATFRCIRPPPPPVPGES